MSRDPRPAARAASPLAGLAVLLAPALALAQTALPVQQPPPPEPATAWPLGLIVLGVAIVFLAGWLYSRRRGGRNRGTA